MAAPRWISSKPSSGGNDMKASLALATLALALLQTCGNARAGTLDAELKGKDGWIGYRVPMIEGAGQPCCFEWHGKRPAQAGCDPVSYTHLTLPTSDLV